MRDTLLAISEFFESSNFGMIGVMRNVSMTLMSLCGLGRNVFYTYYIYKENMHSEVFFFLKQCSTVTVGIVPVI